MLTDAGYLVVPKDGPTIPIQNTTLGVHIRIRSMSHQPAYAGSLQKGLEYIGIDTAGELDDANAGKRPAAHAGCRSRATMPASRSLIRLSASAMIRSIRTA